MFMACSRSDNLAKRNQTHKFTIVLLVAGYSVACGFRVPNKIAFQDMLISRCRQYIPLDDTISDILYILFIIHVRIIIQI